jgi:hypothetical protein
VAVGERLRDRFARVIFVPLAAVTHPRLVLDGVARAVGADLGGAGSPAQADAGRKEADACAAVRRAAVRRRDRSRRAPARRTARSPAARPPRRERTREPATRRRSASWHAVRRDQGVLDHFRIRRAVPAPPAAALLPHPRRRAASAAASSPTSLARRPPAM